MVMVVMATLKEEEIKDIPRLSNKSITIKHNERGQSATKSIHIFLPHTFESSSEVHLE